MGEAPLILGVSGLRGIVGESLTPEVAVRYAGAFGSWICSNHESWGGVVVARDGRLGGEVIYEAVIAGLLGVGCTVKPIGVSTTPTAGVAVDSLGYMGALVITASHNPQPWNGIKGLVFHHDEDIGDEVTARAPSLDEANEIIRIFKQGVEWNHANSSGELKPEESVLDEHIRRVAIGRLTVAGDRERSFSVVLDSVNASGAEVALRMLRTDPNLLDYERHQVTQLHGEGTGIFPHTPEPTRENLSVKGGLCDVVPKFEADVGFAQDPDADRLAIVDEMGEYIGEEYTLVLAALSLLETVANADEDDEFPDSPPVIVTNLSTSRMIDDVAARYRARVERTAVGEANVVERMKALRRDGHFVLLGGEGNGGVIWPRVTFVRDSLGAMALTLGLMARKGMKVSELVSWIDSMAGVRGDGYVILKRKVDIPSKDAAAPAVEAVRRGCEGEDGAVIDLQDGVRVDWPGERAWVHVRASNTEPIMRLICEAPSEGAAEALLARIEGMIAAG